MRNSSIREHVYHLIRAIIPYDDLEQEDINDAYLWIESGAPIFRIQIFLTSTLTVGLTAGHTDVSLWYVLKGDSNKAYEFDKEEFNDIRWFHLNDVPYKKSDPHMGRFIQKLKGKL